MKKRRKLKRKVVNTLVDCLDHIEFVLAAIEGSAELDHGSVVRAGLAVSWLTCKPVSTGSIRGWQTVKIRRRGG